MLPKEQRIQTKQQLEEWLEYELPKYGRGGLQSVYPLGERAILRKHQALLRKREYHTNAGHKLRALYFRIRLSQYQSRYALHIPCNVCAKGLRIMHLGPILINGNAAVGENCCLHINTGIVAGGTNDEAPVLGNNVVVGIGAVILGGVHIADYTAIGANAVVNKDVCEENIAVAGIPARKVSNNGSKEWNKRAKTI